MLETVKASVFGASLWPQLLGRSEFGRYSQVRVGWRARGMIVHVFEFTSRVEK